MSGTLTQAQRFFAKPAAAELSAEEIHFRKRALLITTLCVFNLNEGAQLGSLQHMVAQTVTTPFAPTVEELGSLLEDLASEGIISIDDTEYGSRIHLNPDVYNWLKPLLHRPTES